MATADVDSTSPTGRPKASPVWDFFCYNSENNDSVCQVDKEEKICGVKIKGKNPTNLKQHLSRYHKPEYETVLLKEEEAKSKRSSQSVCKHKGLHKGQNTIDKLLQPKKFS
uniref:BED-type domain-containing protein n=1 Tax=Amphimedon queenslandica TaxID=400682 RepID=A0A1X7VBW2_AMPQE